MSKLGMRRALVCRSICSIRYFLWKPPAQMQNVRYLSTSTKNLNTGMSLKKEKDSIQIKWNGTNFWSNFHHIWLRDNCQCRKCYHPETHQRLLDVVKIEADLRPRSVEINDNTAANESNDLNSSCLSIEWIDGHRSVYPISWLQQHSYDVQGVKECVEGNKIDPVVWGKEISNTPPSVDYDEYMRGDHTFLEWSDNVDRYGFCFIDGIPLEPIFTKKAMERAGVLRNTFFGPLWDVEVNSTDGDELEFGDTAYTSLAIDSHTDGTYFHEAPGLQMFHVLYFNGSGGESVLVDGFKLAEVIQEENPYHYHILSKVPLTYQYKDKDHVYLNSVVPFTIDQETMKISEVHFNNCDRLPIGTSSMNALHKINPDGTVADIYGAIQTFTKTTRNFQYQYKFLLQPGRAVIFNNHRVLHARTAFTNTRRLYGGYINKEDWKSRVTVARKRLANST